MQDVHSQPLDPPGGEHWGYGKQVWLLFTSLICFTHSAVGMLWCLGWAHSVSCVHWHTPCHPGGRLLTPTSQMLGSACCISVVLPHLLVHKEWYTERNDIQYAVVHKKNLLFFHQCFHHCCNLNPLLSPAWMSTYLHLVVCYQYYTHLHPGSHGVYLVSKQVMCVDNESLESGYLVDFSKVGKPQVFCWSFNSP